MILHPPILALTLLSIMTSGLVLYAGLWAMRILVRWDLSSGSEQQLELERRTYLVSTLVAYALGFEVASAFLFVHTADLLAPLFTGAMCAAGTLNANAFGYPVLGLKIVTTLAAGAWLVVNHADNRAPDYPLIEPKYALVLAIAPLVTIEAVLQTKFFISLRPDIITSCCGSLFGEDRSGLGAGLASLPRTGTAAALYGTMAIVVALGALFRWTGRGALLYAIASAGLVPIGIAAVVAFLSPYVYELPTHHCPFCLLQKEYRYVGYLWYGALVGAGICGIAVGVLHRYRQVPTLTMVIPAIQRGLVMTATALLLVFAASTMWTVTTSHLRM